MASSVARFTASTNIMLDPKTRAVLDAIAKEENVTMSELMRALVKVALRSEKDVRALVEL